MEYQGITKVVNVGDIKVIHVMHCELLAHWRMGRNTAIREGFTGVSERTRADLDVFENMKPGDRVVIEWSGVA